MARILAALLAGVLLGAGLALSGMTDPRVVIGFLDVAGAWNPALALVMAGAVTVTFVGYRLVFRCGRPLLAESFSLPAPKAIDSRLLLGAALFGVGWGLAGYCPGPALASLSAGATGTLIFVAAMAAGLAVVKAVRANF
ncbi:MAG: DUF6691 family protein [Rhodospirillaceae bacterium]